MTVSYALMLTFRTAKFGDFRRVQGDDDDLPKMSTF